jgi:hypothetical protein
VTKHGEQTFLAIDNVLRPGKSFARKQRALGAHTSSPRIDSVFHVGQLASSNRARTKCSRRANANRRHHFFRREIQGAPRSNRRRECAQCRVVPTVFAHAWSSDFAKAHFNFVGNNRGEN